MNLDQNKIAKAKYASFLSFLAAGLSTAPWASILPYVNTRLELTELHYASLVLCYGLGAILAMPLTPKIVKTIGLRQTIFFAMLILFSAMTILSHDKIILHFAYIAVLIWGMSIGILDVANNIHAALLEKITQKNLMSMFHALFTIGCIISALMFNVLLYLDMHSFHVALLVSMLGLILLILLYNKLLKTPDENEQISSTSNKNKLLKLDLVLLCMGTICFIMYLCEGMIYDWSGVYLVKYTSINIELAAIGYLLFEISTALMRFIGDYIVTKLGKVKILIASGVIACISLTTIASSNNSLIILICFFITGIALANIVPIMFSSAAKYRADNQASAIAFVGTLGYAGLLFGPAILGGVATLSNLKVMLLFVASLTLVITFLTIVIYIKLKTCK